MISATPSIRTIRPTWNLLARPAASALLLLAILATGTPPLRAQTERSLAQAQELIDARKPQQALPLLDALLAREPANARGLLLRSTARFLTDDLDGGKKDLDRALELDPTLRQGWLNRAALEVAGKRYDAALAAFARAEVLDPKAADNDLNIGAVLLLEGKLEPSSARFASYVAKRPGTADAEYQVASNYAGAGYSALAVEHLKRAIQLDERSRLRARVDANFSGLAKEKRFAELLDTDAYRPPPGAHRASRSYDVPYDPQDDQLLGSVVEAMQVIGERFDPRVESATNWALIWGDLRIKVTRTADGKGLVEVSAAAERMPEAEWRRRTDKLFQAIVFQLYNRRAASVKRKP
ncbi:MAG TPA: hypothetical protein VOA87_00165 [Thermoanaerobaculia bacterium]|nr:hypothetical protein [Thermoanaerobaculia bacterium]